MASLASKWACPTLATPGLPFYSRVTQDGAPHDYFFTQYRFEHKFQLSHLQLYNPNTQTPVTSSKEHSHE